MVKTVIMWIKVKANIRNPNCSFSFLGISIKSDGVIPVHIELVYQFLCL
jgi:hypothetical protein